MQQRQLRLGDIVDDYCPRERRVTNHAIVAMIEDQVKQTRCTTCDAEHEYKAAKVPPQRKKKESTSALYKQVLSDAKKPDAPMAMLSRHNNGDHSRPRDPESEPEPMEAPPAAPVVPHVQVTSDPDPTIADPTIADPTDPPPPSAEEEGPVHRPLIRATLPRPAGQTPERPAPEFTFRNLGRPGRFRGGPGRGPQRPNRPQGGGGGNVHGPARSAGARPQAPGGRGGNRGPSPQGSRPAQRGPHGGPRHGRGKKRSK
jgi:translation initiation factor IF-2